MTSHYPVPRRVVLSVSLGLAAVVWLGCAEPGQAPETTAADSSAVIPGLTVSNPVIVSAASGSSSVSLNAADDVAYISMQPGALRGVLSVRIRNLTTNGPATETIPVFDGGFDPVPVAARAGDRLALLQDLEGGAGIIASYLTVPVRRPPRIVRTAPPKGRTDVAFKTRPLIVFSEPIDPRTLSNTTIQLLAGGVAVSGSVAPVPGDALLAEFTPAAPLASNTNYELLITTGVRDLEGDALESSERIAFTTEAVVASVVLSNVAPTTMANTWFDVWATVTGSNGNALNDRIVSWSVSDTSVAKVYQLGASSRTAQVIVSGTGTATITASSEGRSTGVTFRSIADPSAAPGVEVLDLRMIQYSSAGWSYAPQLRLRESAGQSGVYMLSAQFVIPGIGASIVCSSYQPVGAWEVVDVFQEVYGDYELSFEGVRATLPIALVIISIEIPNGRSGRIARQVPIVESAPPVYGSGRSQGRWSCGR